MPADTCAGPCAQLLHFAMPLDTFKVRSTTGGNTRVARCADAIQGVPDGEPGAWTLAAGLSDVYSPLGQGPSLRRGKKITNNMQNASATNIYPTQQQKVKYQ